MTKNNPIIEEVRAAREALAAKFDFDIHRIYEDAVARQSAKTAAETASKPAQDTQDKNGKHTVRKSKV